MQNPQIIMPFEAVLELKILKGVLSIVRLITVVAKLAKSFGTYSFRKSWRLPPRTNRTVIDRVAPKVPRSRPSEI